ncbi:TIGR00159 family protein [Pseudodesulfovibrio sp. F-1]|uniref:Diadenylate cyclase n=1 Tax=Pseudodesulfovibrio alkaliphilus TaxID=2661613 RepID=A0A7K1KLC6_9BACT|nr:diadenylate cyclase CdaA [Pseudodesulfovibrio alkaliphilus]MUM76865.1 TIGR00159 family protein [Pseudodesulfovibrio alkaliphilus]
MFELFGMEITWRVVLDIVLVGVIYYNIILLVRGTRAAAVLYGMVVVLIIYYFSEQFNLYTLSTLLGEFLSSLFLVVVILFRTDIRKALASVGTKRFWTKSQVRDDTLDSLIQAAMNMAHTSTGAIMVIEKNMPLGDIVERGIELDAKVNKELLETIFVTDTPLHDGAVIIRRDRIVAAACILPLSSKLRGQPMYGTRHRAALGISEESDAVIIVISEERGEVSVAMNGRLTTSLDEVRLRRVLRNALGR